MPGMYDYIASYLGQLPTNIANSAMGVASGPVGLNQMADQAQQSAWDQKWDLWQRDPSSFPVQGPAQPFNPAQVQPNVMPPGPPPVQAPYGGPPIPQQLPQTGASMSQGIMPMGPMDVAAGGPGAPEPMSPMETMPDYIPVEKGIVTRSL